MLGRPNLARYQCQEIRIVFQLDLSEELSLAALQGSYNYRDDQGIPIAIYGKTYKANQLSHIVDGSISRVESHHHHFSFHVRQEDRGRPPTNIKSPDLLWKLALGAAPALPVDTSFFGNYRYAPESKWYSSLGFPFELTLPLVLPRVSQFTHIAGARFTNFDGDALKDSIDVMVEPGGGITHEVRLQREMVIDSRLIKSLFREGNRISSALIIEQKDVSDDDC